MQAADLNLIACEHGLGTLTSKACGLRWAMANGHVPRTAHNQADLARMRRAACKGCKHGAARCTTTKRAKRDEIFSVRRRRQLPVVVGPIVRLPAPPPIALPARGRS